MPELPEVETTVRGLRRHIIGKVITDVWSDFHLGSNSKRKDDFKAREYYKKGRALLIGRTVARIDRVGKNIFVRLDESLNILIHMKMTGHLLVDDYDKSDPMNKDKFIHFRISFEDGSHLFLSDMRKFASIEVVTDAQLGTHRRTSRLGPDLFDRSLTAEVFAKRLIQKENIPLKSKLLDQGTVSGIGNIYADEGLFATSIHPESLARAVGKTRVAKLYVNLKSTMLESLKVGGDSKSDYRNIHGKKGGFQDFHKVYGRKSQKCNFKVRGGVCGGTIQRIVIRGRSTHYCPTHQKLFK